MQVDATNFADDSLELLEFESNAMSYGQLRHALFLWWPKVMQRGLVLGPNYSRAPVADAVHEFARHHSVRVWCTRGDANPKFYFFKMS